MNKIKKAGAIIVVTLMFCSSHFAVAQSLGASMKSLKIEWPKTDFDNAVVDFREIMSGGVPKDGIPAVDNPQFVSQEEASEWLSPKEPVIVLNINGKARAYPLQILIWHEIVNDTLNGKHVSVTFCPLCNASIVFDRAVDGEVLDFGTTGRLRKSDLVMYDRQTESWWQQITGRGLIGNYADVKLDQLPSQIVSYEAFQTAYPDSVVLSRNTGHFRSYGSNPYRGYDNIDSIPFLYSDPTDPRLPAMERIVNVSVGNRHRVYPFRVFKETPVINDKINGIPIVLFSSDDSVSVLDERSIANSKPVPSVTVFRRETLDNTLTFEQRVDGFYDLETGSRWNIFGQAVAGDASGTQLPDITNGIHFAFAWLAFYPDSEIYAP